MLGVVFDCDGVLADSELLSQRAWLPVLARRGLQIALADIAPFIGKSDQALLESFSRETQIELGSELIAEREAEYFAIARGRLMAFPGELEALSELKRRGAPMAVASSGRPEKISFSLTEVGIIQFFDAVCSVTEVARGKPAPDLFLLGAKKLGVVPERCVAVEDSLFGIMAAREAGMTVLGYTSSHPASSLRDAGAHYVFENYSELVPLMDRLA